VLFAGLALWVAAPAMASTFTVSNLDDSGTGSLRQAVIDANNDGSPPAVIDFTPGLTGLINLSSGTLAITGNDVTIQGPGPGTLEIDGDGVQTLSVSASSNVSISGLRFGGGAAATTGGAISNAGILTVSDARFDHNRAGGDSLGAGKGGAIYNTGTLIVSDSTFSENSSGGAGDATDLSGLGGGGAIYDDMSGSVTVIGSTFTGNSAGGDGGGGGDSGDGLGGAIDVSANSSLVLTDSTFIANTAGGAPGGGIESGVGNGAAIGIESNARATLIGDTIDANIVGSAGGSGAGIDNAGTASIVGTIVSGNSGAGNCFSSGTMSGRSSLEGPSGQASCGFDLPSADPSLGPLADNGGPTETQALGARSPAIGAVASALDCPASDQRGATRLPGHCDVGAYEVAQPVISLANAFSIATTSANLATSVFNPDVEAGTVAFQYGTSTAYGTSTPAQVLPVASGPPGLYTAPLAGLRPGTVYHFRVVATNPDGTAFGPDQQFTTASSPVPPPAPPSNVFTFGKAKVGPRGTVTLAVNAPGAGRFTAKAKFTVITRKGHKRVKKTFTYGTARVSSTGRGTFKLVIRLSRRAARELKLLGSRQVTIAVTFTPTGGTARHKTKKVPVRRSRKGKYS
jgi:hypothetical protein